MKKLMCLLVVGVLAIPSGFALASDTAHYGPVRSGPALFGRPILFSQVPPPEPAPDASMQPEMMSPGPAGAVPLYNCVRYQDLRNVAPCAVPMIVSVPDPCASSDPCSCCAPPCVNVQICVPPCGCPEVKVSRRGTRIKYDYGKYAMKITSRRGVVTVNYDD